MRSGRAHAAAFQFGGSAQYAIPRSVVRAGDGESLVKL